MKFTLNGICRLIVPAMIGVISAEVDGQMLGPCFWLSISGYIIGLYLGLTDRRK